MVELKKILNLKRIRNNMDINLTIDNFLDTLLGDVVKKVKLR